MSAWHGVLEELVRDRRPALVGYASLFTGNRRDAEDLVQDAIIRSFGRARSFNHVNAAESYVRKAIASAYIDRARSHRSWLAALPKLVEPDLEAHDDDVARRTDVHAAFALLSPRQRSCVVLRFYDDLTVARIAATLGLSEGAVKRYLSDGIRNLNAALGTEADPDGAPVPEPQIQIVSRRRSR